MGNFSKELVINSYGQHYTIDRGRWTHIVETKSKKQRYPTVYIDGKKILSPTKKYTIDWLIENENKKKENTYGYANTNINP